MSELTREDNARAVSGVLPQMMRGRFTRMDVAGSTSVLIPKSDVLGLAQIGEYANCCFGVGDGVGSIAVGDEALGRWPSSPPSWTLDAFVGDVAGAVAFEDDVTFSAANSSKASSCVAFDSAAVPFSVKLPSCSLPPAAPDEAESAPSVTASAGTSLSAQRPTISHPLSDVRGGTKLQ